MTEKVYVYFVQSGRLGPIKIGIARRVAKRIEQLQIGNPEDLRLVGCIECKNRTAAEDMEKHLHWLLRRHYIRGEWFSGKIQISKLRDNVIPVYSKEENEEIAMAYEARQRQG